MSFFNTLKFIINHPLNRHQTIPALFRFLRWQLGSRLISSDIVYTWLHGARFIVRTGETGFTQNIYCGLQDFQEMGYLLHVLRQEDLFVDVGANIGAYTVLAGAVLGARAICFEPIPSTYNRLIANIRINHLEQIVKPMNIGISNEVGNLLFTNDSDTMNRVVDQTETGDYIDVEVSKLDILLADEQPSLIKIDVEGYETQVLNGAQGTLKKDSLHSLIVEMNGNGYHYGFDEAKIIDHLCWHGFLPYEYDPFYRTFKPRIAENLFSGNTLFVRNLQVLETRVQRAPKYFYSRKRILILLIDF